MNNLMFILILSLFIPSTIFGKEPKSFKTDDSETLFYTHAGSGPRVVLLYGGPGLGANLMLPWLDSLACQYEPVLFEQRGTGLSTNVKIDSTTINVQRACQDIDNLREHLGDNKLTLCGYSWGGMLALAYAARYPEHVRNIVLVSTGPIDATTTTAYGDNIKWNTYTSERDSIAYWSEPEQQKSDSVGANIFKMTFSFMNRFYDHKLGRKILEQWLQDADFNLVVNDLMWKDIYKYKDFNFAVEAKSYKGQCNIIRSRQDVVPAEVVFRIAESMPQSKIYFIEECGHCADLEKPKELFSLLRDVLSEKDE